MSKTTPIESSGTKLKTLASCKPSEFLRQTNKIRHAVAKWLTDTDIMNIRKRLPELTKITDDMSDEEKKKVFAENKALSQKQARENLSSIFDAILDEHPDETLEILALTCFIEPENADNYPVSTYLEAFSELIRDKAVLDFFISLTQLGQTGILDTAKA